MSLYLCFNLLYVSEALKTLNMILIKPSLSSISTSSFLKNSSRVLFLILPSKSLLTLSNRLSRFEKKLLNRLNTPFSFNLYNKEIIKFLFFEKNCSTVNKLLSINFINCCKTISFSLFFKLSNNFIK